MEAVSPGLSSQLCSCSAEQTSCLGPCVPWDAIPHPVLHMQSSTQPGKHAGARRTVGLSIWFGNCIAGCLPLAPPLPSQSRMQPPVRQRQSREDSPKQFFLPICSGQSPCLHLSPGQKSGDMPSLYPAGTVFVSHATRRFSHGHLGLQLPQFLLFVVLLCRNWCLALDYSNLSACAGGLSPGFCQTHCLEVRRAPAGSDPTPALFQS